MNSKRIIAAIPLVFGLGSLAACSDAKTSSCEAGTSEADASGSGGVGGTGGDGNDAGVGGASGSNSSGGSGGAGGTSGSSGAAGSAGKDAGPLADARADATDTGNVDDGAADSTSPPTDAGAGSNVGSVDFSGTGDVVITAQNGEIATDTGKIGGATSPTTAFKFLTIDQPLGAPTIAVFIAQSFRIEASAGARVTGSRPVVLIARNKIEIFGLLTAGGQHGTATAGGSPTTAAGKGGGLGGGGGLLSYNASGGGSFCGIGGTGNATSDAGASGVGGPAYGMPSLIPLLGGSAGGGEATFAGGGAGGGAIQLTAGGSVVIGISGSVDVGGGGAATNGGAGGSGGAILIEAPSVTIAGIAAANGGGGEIYTGGPSGQNGQPGATPAAGSAPTAGNGSADTEINGGNGSMTGTSNNSSGGGGGGAGRIRINSTGAAAMITGTISPAITTPCFSQGTF